LQRNGILISKLRKDVYTMEEEKEKNMINREVVLPRRVVQQEVPPLYEGGDCGACVIAGLVDMSVADVYTLSERHRKQKLSPFCWHSAYYTLHELLTMGRLDRLITKVPFWGDNDSRRYFGDPSWMQGGNWWDWVAMGVDAGYYGLMHYNMEGLGAEGLPNHYVMVVGAREVEVPSGKGWFVQKELLISCSSSRTPVEPWWIAVQDLLRLHGGFNVVLARPAG
jgi:hypothetical protein